MPFLMVASFSVNAGPGVGLDNTELVDVVGQGGADLSWTLSLNHQYANDLSLKNISKTNGVDP